MSAPLSLLTLRSTLDREGKRVEEVADELLLDLDDGAGTQHLAGTCYGQAVTGCRRIGENHFVLDVNPDLRMVLYKQLKERYRIYRLFRFLDEPDTRMLFTGEVFIRFRSSSYAHERCSAVRNFLADAPRISDPRDGFYLLIDAHRESPIAASIGLELDLVVDRSSPVILILPEGIAEGAEPVLLKTD